MVNVFNDIIIDRRRHGLNRDWSKPITLSDIVQKKIEVPCILGDRGIILKSLENEPGRYKMPLIILQMKGLKTDTPRMFDLHSDIFYQQDDSFSNLDYDNPMYRPKELSKMRAQPINISYDVTFITRYREDLDQIISNFSVHFRPDIYLKWWHPRNKVRALESQVLWDHSVSFDSMVDFNPQNIFTYKGTSSFTLRSWLFYGMHATDNAIDPELEPIIEKIKIFPNRTDGVDDLGNDPDVYHDDDIWVFGDIMNTPSGVTTVDNGNKSTGFGFWGVDEDQDFIGTDEDQMKNGQYAVNNVFAENYPAISGDPVISKISENKNAGDFISKNDRLNNYSQNQYQMYLELDTHNKKNIVEFKNVYFKGSFPQSAMYESIPSGDYVFQEFFKSYVGRKKAKAEFGDCYNLHPVLNVNYDIASKDLTLWSDYEDDKIKMQGRAKFNSKTGHLYEFLLQSKPVINADPDKYVKFAFHKEYDAEMNHIKENDIVEKYNIRPISDIVASYKTMLLIEETERKNLLKKMLNFIKGYWNIIDLRENASHGYDMVIEDPRFGDNLKAKGLDQYGFRSFDLVTQAYDGGYLYQVIANRYLYIVLKSKESNPDEIDIYDIGAICPLKYASHHALIYEVLIPESRELLGLNFRISL